MTHCPVKRFGLSEGNSIQAFNIRYGPTATEFEIPSFKFHTSFLGEFNVRNALAVVACAKHCGLKNHQIQSAFDTFKGIRRRMEVRGIAGGVTVVDDFGHHPTAIRETLRALRVKYPTQKLWAIFEPRSNTTLPLSDYFAHSQSGRALPLQNLAAIRTVRRLRRPS